MQAVPIVSFVVRAYNYGRFLGDCLQSIFALEGEPRFEVLVIDDGSSDETPTVLRNFRDPRLRCIRHDRNRGHVATINEGLAEACGEFVARIDADDRYRPHFLNETLPRFEARPDVGVVYGNVALIDGRGLVTVARADRAHGGKDFIGNELLRLLEENYVCAPTVIARRAAWLSGWPVPDIVTADDWYLNLQMARRFNFWYVDTVLAEYRVHPANHHIQVVRERTEEPSVLAILDRVYSEHESSPELERLKQRAKRDIYARQFLTLADKYFGSGMYLDARRCYLAAVLYRPGYLGRADLLRRLTATVLGRRHYELLKSRLQLR
jgi:glycosyltransferase involved in cell wall biosynthesis